MFLLTGGHGFLGKYILAALAKHEVQVLGKSSGDIICDLSKDIPKLPSYSLVIHAAGKAHCHAKKEAERQAFFNTNVTGTENLLKGLQAAPSLPKAFIFISSVAVYGLQLGENISENAPLNAKDPYGKSKVLAEALLKEWCEKHNVRLTILRLPLVVGVNAPGNYGAMQKAIKQRRYFNIAGGLAQRSMVLASDVATAILPLSKIGGIFQLTDGQNPTYKALSQALAEKYKVRKPGNLPLLMATALGKWGNRSKRFPLNLDKVQKLTSTLTFSDAKARATGLWHPKTVVKNLP